MPIQNEGQIEGPQDKVEEVDTNSQTRCLAAAENDQSSGNFPWQDHEELG